MQATCSQDSARRAGQNKGVGWNHAEEDWRRNPGWARAHRLWTLAGLEAATVLLKEMDLPDTKSGLYNIPCPFCGKTGVAIGVRDRTRKGAKCYVYCTNCMASGPGVHFTAPAPPGEAVQLEAYRLWNTRVFLRLPESLDVKARQ